MVLCHHQPVQAGHLHLLSETVSTKKHLYHPLPHWRNFGRQLGCWSHSRPDRLHTLRSAVGLYRSTEPEVHRQGDTLCLEYIPQHCHGCRLALSPPSHHLAVAYAHQVEMGLDGHFYLWQHVSTHPIDAQGVDRKASDC